MPNNIQNAVDISANIVHADNAKYYRLWSNLSIFSHDKILEEMKLISPKIAVIVWKPSEGTCASITKFCYLI